MTASDDWFRKPCLSKEAKEEFELKLARSRSSRPEYMRIQAVELKRAEAFEQALALFRRLAADKPTHLRSWVQEWIGDCLADLGQGEEAIDAYVASIEDMLDRGVADARAHLRLAEFVVREERTTLYRRALEYLLSLWEDRKVFPVDTFEQYGWAAVLMRELGENLEEASALAKVALSAADIESSGLPRVARVGLVGFKQKELLSRLSAA